MIMKFIDLFNIYTESDSSKSPNLTEEKIYALCLYLNKSNEKVPVISGQTSQEGVVGYIPSFLNQKDKEGKKERFTTQGINYYLNKEDCITIVKDGRAGKLFFRGRNDYPLFAMTIHAIAIFKKDTEEVKEIKKEYSDFDGLNLEWFFLKFRNLFGKMIKGEGVPSFTQYIYEPLELEIPKISEQIKEIKLLQQPFDLEIILEKIKEKAEFIYSKFLSINSTKYDSTELSSYLDYTSRNDSLSENGIYLLSQELIKCKNTIKVLSGSFDEIYGEVPDKKNLHFVLKKPILQVITRGDAGRLKFFNTGNYATNTNAMVITLKEEKLKELNIKTLEDQEEYLKFLERFLEPYLLEFVSSADLAVFPLSEAIKKIKIPFPKLNEEIKTINKLYDYLRFLLNNLKEYNQTLEILLEKEIIV
jgi:hypothetical protein